MQNTLLYSIRQGQKERVPVPKDSYNKGTDTLLPGGNMALKKFITMI